MEAWYFYLRSSTIKRSHQTFKKKIHTFGVFFKIKDQKTPRMNIKYNLLFSMYCLRKIAMKEFNYTFYIYKFFLFQIRYLFFLSSRYYNTIILRLQSS